MSEEESEQPIWPVILVIIIVGYAFYFSVWVGVIALVIGLVVLGWSRRHDGPFPTDRSDQ